MTPTAIHSVLVTAFSALPRADLARLRYHAERKTPICCGRQADLFADGIGAG